MRRRGMNGDSMELLLDTVCSMFGAITLIAILVDCSQIPGVRIPPRNSPAPT